MRTSGLVLATIAIWVVSASLSGWFAARKGRSARRWFGLGVVLGPFALLLHVLYPARYVGATVPCPKCGKPVGERAVACHHCQYRFPALDVMITKMPDDPQSRRTITNELAREYGIDYAGADRMLARLPVTGYRHIVPDQVDEFVHRLRNAGAEVSVVPSAGDRASR